jgi:hypothetical protein
VRLLYLAVKSWNLQQTLNRDGGFGRVAQIPLNENCKLAR